LCGSKALEKVIPVPVSDFVGVFSSTDRSRILAAAEDLRRAGISALTMPSDRVIGTWDLEVSPGDVDASRVIVGSVPGR
jgi:hypothetical protein